MFKIENGREYFYQYDLNQRLIIDNDSISQVHFCNKTDTCSLVVEVYEEGGKRFADVPNVLLQDNWTIRVYAYCPCYTVVSTSFKVKERTKPADYVYTETEVLTYEALEERIAALEAGGGANLEDFITVDVFHDYINGAYIFPFVVANNFAALENADFECPVNILEPTVNSNPATKKYVDDLFANIKLAEDGEY